MEQLYRHLALAEARNELAMVAYLRQIIAEDKKENDAAVAIKRKAENLTLMDTDY